MKRPSLRGLLRSAVAQVLPSATIGTRWKADMAPVAEDFELQVHQAFQLVGAGLVQSWEIQIAELGRLWAMKHPGREAELGERWSDCLVPIEAPVQALGRVVRKSLERGRAAAEQSGQLADYTAELEGKLTALPPKVAEGWSDCAGHLGPCFEVLTDPEAGEAGFRAAGVTLQAELERVAANFRSDLAEVPEREDLSKALFHAIDRYQEDAVRAIELAVVGGKEAYAAFL